MSRGVNRGDKTCHVCEPGTFHNVLTGECTNCAVRTYQDLFFHTRPIIHNWKFRPAQPDGLN